MEFIIPIKGAVKFNLTLDPTVWIFDDRRIDLKTFFNSTKITIDTMRNIRKRFLSLGKGNN